MRVAVHCTEADCGQQPVTWAKEQGLTVMTFLMMSHMLEPERLAEQARPAGLLRRGRRLRRRLRRGLVPEHRRRAGGRAPAARSRRASASTPTTTSASAVGNALAAAEAGATYIDGSLRGLGAGAGNAQTEVLAAAFERAGYAIDADLFATARHRRERASHR